MERRPFIPEGHVLAVPRVASITKAGDPSPVARDMLLALNARGGHVYAGTVPAHVKARRRAANKRARAARRITRKGR